MSDPVLAEILKGQQEGTKTLARVLYELGTNREMLERMETRVEAIERNQETGAQWRKEFSAEFHEHAVVEEKITREHRDRIALLESAFLLTDAGKPDVIDHHSDHYGRRESDRVWSIRKTKVVDHIFTGVAWILFCGVALILWDAFKKGVAQ